MDSCKTIIIDSSLWPNQLKENCLQTPARDLLHKYVKEAERKGKYEDRKHVGTKIPALGSKKKVLSNGNFGFFSAVLESYNNHWILDMRPEDWFYTFVQKIGLAIDKGAKTEEVRKFFVNHEGKKQLNVVVQETSPLDVDYSWFLDQMTSQIEKNINTPDYVDLMTANFSTSTKNDRIISSITTMMSLQEFFEYRMCIACGIPAVTMQGSEEDWICLKRKIENLEKLLQPIREQLNPFLPPNWWKNIINITENLLETYKGSPNLDWWHNIIIKTEQRSWGSGGGSGVRWAGWFLTDILGQANVEYLSEIESPLVTVPLTIDDNGAIEEAAFIAGIVGYVVKQDEKVGEEKSWPRVSTMHSWTFVLEPQSKYLKVMKNWEDKIFGA